MSTTGQSINRRSLTSVRQMLRHVKVPSRQLSVGHAQNSTTVDYILIILTQSHGKIKKKVILYIHFFKIISRKFRLTCKTINLKISNNMISVTISILLLSYIN